MILLAEESRRRTIRARLIAARSCGSIESLSEEAAVTNAYTPPDSLERCLLLDRLFPLRERPFEGEDDDSRLPSSEKQRRQEVRDRAAAAGVPDIEGYAQQSPYRPPPRTSALSPHPGSTGAAAKATPTRRAGGTTSTARWSRAGRRYGPFGMRPVSAPSS